MLIAEITVQGVEATASIRSKITAGMVGATVRIRYPDPYWSGLVKNVVFRGAEEQPVLNTGETVEIPAKVIAKANARLMIGIVGVSTAGNTQVTPTIWAELGVVNAAPNVSQQISGGGKPPALGTPPSQNAPLWAQVEAMIGDLNALGTNDRDNVVAAINELVRQTGNVEALITDDKTSIVSAINWIVREGIGTPEIGSNGNWIIGGKDTGLPSRGPKGDQGASGVYVGSGEMPDGYNVQIDPDGEPLDLVIDPEAIKNAVDEYLEENPPAQGAPGKTPVKGEDYFTQEDVQEIAEVAAGLVEVPDGGGGGETWDILANMSTDVDIVKMVQTEPPEGRTFDEYDEFIVVVCVTPNESAYTSGVKLNLFGDNSWAGKFTFPVAGFGSTTGVAKIGVLHISKTNYGMIVVQSTPSNGAGSLNNQMLHESSNKAVQSWETPYPGNTVPEDLTTIFPNGKVTNIAVGGYQTVLGAGSKMVAFGKRKA